MNKAPYELSIAWKYLIPKRKSLSSALISLLSITVITLVVWLVVLFLSVTAGIEKNWLYKLTSLQAPIRIYPTPEYFSSYYYLIDGYSSSSSYQTKNIGEKAISPLTDPYQAESDIELPFPRKQINVDPVKKLYDILQKTEDLYPSLRFQEYEYSAALMRLQVDYETILSQVNYISTFPSDNPNLPSLLIPPSFEQIKEAIRVLPSHLHSRILPFVQIEEITIHSFWQIPDHFLPKKGSLVVYTDENKKNFYLTKANDQLEKGTLTWDGKKYTFIQNKSHIKLSDISLIAPPALPLKVLQQKGNDLVVSFSIENMPFQGELSSSKVIITKGTPITHFSTVPNPEPLWPYLVQGKGYLPKWDQKKAIVLPKSYQKQKVSLFSQGSLHYTSQHSLSGQELQIPFYVAGFYDPGVLPVGGRYLFADAQSVRAISAQAPAISIDGTPTNGLFVWYDDLKEAPSITKEIQKKIQKEMVAPFWTVENFYDFSFSQELLQQFQSDRTLFTLLAFIIITVACSNVISFLILLVKDKKREIAILRAMGATKSSIAFIFGSIGAFIGSLGSILGTLLAMVTLYNLDGVIALLSKIQGHKAFQPAFFGDTLPNSLSMDAVWFIFIITPILSLIAGLIPAIKAAKIHCSQTLRENG